MNINSKPSVQADAKTNKPEENIVSARCNIFQTGRHKMAVLEEVELGHDEVEAIRLKHLEKLDQEAAARQMGVSQPTFHRLLSSAHEKLAEAVIKGKALRIEGGNVTVQEDFQVAGCEKSRDCGRRLRNRAAGSSNQPTPREEGRKVIVVASVDGTLQGPVDERFGRCRKLMVYDPETRTVRTVDNQTNKAVAQGVSTRRRALLPLVQKR